MSQHKERIQDIINGLQKLEIGDLIELQKDLQHLWNIPDDALTSVAATAAPQAGEAESEEEATYNLIVKEMKDPSKKIKCTIFLKNTFKLDMQKCKEVLENIANKPVVQPNISKEDADKFIAAAKDDDIQLVLERVKA